MYPYQTFGSTSSHSLPSPHQLAQDMKQIPTLASETMPTPCCLSATPCHTTDISFQPNRFSHGPTYISWSELNLQPTPINPPGDRLKYGDLNPSLYWRNMIQGAEWSPDMTQLHPHARQKWLQYAYQSKWSRGSAYEKRIETIGDTWMAVNKRFGPPQYVTF